ncbi:MAG: ParA-like protein, partial [uncultured Solirubrobacteraceae bacterium]
GRDHRDPLPEGRHRQDDVGPHPHRRPASCRPPRARGGPRPAGQPVGLLRRRSGGHADGRRRAGGPREGQGGHPRRRHPGEPVAGRGGAGARGQDGPGAHAQARAQGRQEELRRHLPRLPAHAGPVDRQRAGLRGLRDAHRRGPVLRDAGRRAGARGHRSRQRLVEPGPGMARGRVQHRRYADRALARRVHDAQGGVRRQAVRPDDPLVDRLRRVGRARRLDPRSPPGPGRGLRAAGRRDARSARSRRSAPAARAAPRHRL